jgi:hypothetical protein
MHIAVGEGVELTEEQEAAVGKLLQSLEGSDPEVTGHTTTTKPCRTLTTCTDKSCSPVKCGKLVCNGLTAGLTASSGSWGLTGTFSPTVQ